MLTHPVNNTKIKNNWSVIYIFNFTFKIDPETEKIYSSYTYDEKRGRSYDWTIDAENLDLNDAISKCKEFLAEKKKELNLKNEDLRVRFPNKEDYWDYEEEYKFTYGEMPPVFYNIELADTYQEEVEL